MIPIWWTESARADLQAIFNYVARDSRLYAMRLVSRIHVSVE